MVVFDVHRVDLGAAMMVMTITVMMLMILRLGRLFLMLTTRIHRWVNVNWMVMIGTDDTSTQADHHTKNHEP